MKKLIILLALVAGLWAEEIYATFTAKGVREASLKLNASGIVESISVDVGDRVKKGDVLLKIHNGTQLQSLNIQKAALASAEQLYAFQKNQFERYEQSKNAVDKNTFEQIFFNFKKTENDLNAASAQTKFQEEMLANTYLKAPFDGVIAERSIEIGDGVTQNNTALFRVISNEVKLVIEFDSRYAGKVAVGDVFSFSIDNAKEKQSAKITKIYPAIDTATRKMKAEARVSAITAGVFGDGYIRTK